jgi:hypothetical protein
MYRPLILTSLATIILASSCDKAGVLKKERAKVEAQIQHTREEIHSVEAKFQALLAAPISNGMTLERYHEEVAKKNDELEAKLAVLSKKCAEAEAVLSEIRPRLDTYKAKYLY